MDGTLVGVIVGGILGAFGMTFSQLLFNANQKDIRRREELLPVASRALNSARQSWEMLVGNAVAASRPDLKGNDGSSHENYLKRWNDAYQELLLALDELSLLIPDIESQNQVLRESLKIGTLLPGYQHEEQRQAYLAAHKALQERIRRFLKP